MRRQDKQAATNTAQGLGEEAERNRQMGGKRSFLGYVWAAIRGSTVYMHTTRLLTYLRRFRTVALVLRVTSVIFAVLETGALVILSTVIFVILLPLVLALVLGILITALIEARRTNRMLTRASEGRPVCLLFLHGSEGDFFLWHARDLVKRGYTVILLSPHLISPRELGNRRFYCTAREIGDGIFLARRYYFFSLRRRVLSQRETVYVY